MTDLTNKNALVIGGTGGIGLSVAKLLKDSGANVVVAGRKSIEETHGIKSIFVDFDQGDSSLEQISKPDLKKQLQCCDILVFTYGPFIQKKIHETTVDDWKKMALDDYALPGMAVSSVLPGMMERKFGRILLFGGTRTGQINGYKTNAAYAGAKTGISVIIKSVSTEYYNYGITCNGILPGFTRNPPDKNMLISENSIASGALNLIKSPDLNGVLLNIDRGWNP